MVSRISKSSIFVALLCISPALGWTTRQHGRTARIALTQQSASRIAVPASELVADLTDDERTVVSVVRSSGPSVAYVASVLPFDTLNSGRRQRSRQPTFSSNKTDANTLPRGQSLGSGSAFVVDSEGYLVTNYHVVESAYQMIETAKSLDTMVDNFVSNVTNLTGCSFEVVNSTLQSLFPPPTTNTPEVFVRISSDTRYQKCRFVDVKPDLDVAVLKIVETPPTNETSTSTTALPPVKFGSSSDLLVGQSLVAIGKFGNLF